MSNPKKLLIVDDEPDVAEVLKSHFKRKGLEVFACASGEEAVKLIAEIPLDIIILDYKLSNSMTGLDVVKYLSKSNFNPKVIFLTGALEDNVKEEAESLKVETFLTKPVSFSQLDELVLQDPKE